MGTAHVGVATGVKRKEKRSVNAQACAKQETGKRVGHGRRLVMFSYKVLVERT